MSAVRPSLDADEFMNLLHGSDPVKLELNRLENEVRDKDRELSEAHAEIKALRLSERLREKAVEELTDELTRVDEKLKLTESLLESKLNLQQKPLFEGSMLLKRMMICRQLRPSLHLWRLNSNFLVKRLGLAKLLVDKESHATTG